MIYVLQDYDEVWFVESPRTLSEIEMLCKVTNRGRVRGVAESMVCDEQAKTLSAAFPKYEFFDWDMNDKKYVPTGQFDALPADMRAELMDGWVREAMREIEEADTPADRLAAVGIAVNHGFIGAEQGARLLEPVARTYTLGISMMPSPASPMRWFTQ